MSGYKTHIHSLVPEGDHFTGDLYTYRKHYGESYEEVIDRCFTPSNPPREFVLVNGAKFCVRHGMTSSIDGMDSAFVYTIGVDWGSATNRHQQLLQEAREATKRLEAFEEEVLSVPTVSK